MTVNISFNKRSISLEAKKRVIQSPSEKVTYLLGIAAWDVNVSGVPTILKIVDILIPDTDLKSTLFPSGSASSDSNDITLPRLEALTLGKTYRCHVNFTDSVDTFEATFLIECRN